jgi:hypothetical protein
MIPQELSVVVLEHGFKARIVGGGEMVESDGRNKKQDQGFAPANAAIRFWVADRHAK